ncbi:MAG: alpha/beta hydrolase [Clostridiales bacterium]|nr:alpha/beta hydrolase [Clostridiales bacterium]
MEAWMIALIAVAGVILILAIVFFSVVHVYSNYVIGSNYKEPEESDPSKYGVDTSWFDTDEVKSALGEEKITSFDGLKLVAWTLKHKQDLPVKKVAILQHGYHSGPRSMQPFAQMFFDKGFDVYIPAARGHNISEGKHIGMAWLDRFDIMRWIDKVVGLYGSDVQIALFGISMGGSAVAAVSGMQPPPQVKCVIDDCGFSSQVDQYNSLLSGVKIPKPLLMIPFTLGVRFKCGYSVVDADICALVNNSKLPTLFIHGERDSFVPAELGKKLYEACGAEDKRLELFDAGHAASVAADRERYSSLINEFVDKYIKGEPASEEVEQEA